MAQPITAFLKQKRTLAELFAETDKYDLARGTILLLTSRLSEND